MGNAKTFIDSIKAFNSWDIGGSKTQNSSKITEDFVEGCIKKAYPKSIVYKMGSQQHPDFLVAPSSAASSIEQFKSKIKAKKITKGVLEKWEDSSFNENKIRLARIEAKTGETVYTLNDTFPEPSKELDEIYILFSIGKEKVYVTTSFTMAEKCKCNPPIAERFKRSENAVKRFGMVLSRIWEGIGISTAARPTYRMDKTYAHHEADEKSINAIFKRAGL